MRPEHLSLAGSCRPNRVLGVSAHHSATPTQTSVNFCPGGNTSSQEALQLRPNRLPPLTAQRHPSDQLSVAFLTSRSRVDAQAATLRAPGLRARLSSPAPCTRPPRAISFAWTASSREGLRPPAQRALDGMSIPFLLPPPITSENPSRHSSVLHVAMKPLLRARAAGPGQPGSGFGWFNRQAWRALRKQTQSCLKR